MRPCGPVTSFCRHEDYKHDCSRLQSSFTARPRLGPDPEEVRRGRWEYFPDIDPSGISYLILVMAGFLKGHCGFLECFIMSSSSFKLKDTRLTKVKTFHYHSAFQMWSQISSISIAWECGRNLSSQAPSQTY